MAILPYFRSKLSLFSLRLGHTKGENLAKQNSWFKELEHRIKTHDFFLVFLRNKAKRGRVGIRHLRGVDVEKEFQMKLPVGIRHLNFLGILLFNFGMPRSMCLSIWEFTLLVARVELTELCNEFSLPFFKT